MENHSNLRVAVDIGGTFTDTVLVNAAGKIIATAKTPTTPINPTDGAMSGVKHVLETSNSSFADISGFIHGTTLATNALIERRGATVASITNEGFRDILEIAYERRYSQYDINLDKPDLIVPRSRCFTIAGRMNVKGEELEPLNVAAVDKLCNELIAKKIEAIAICLLHSYANDSHEKLLRKLILQRLPEMIVSISSEVSPEAREFDRLCTTIANAYIQPLMARYLASFADAFADNGLNCPILMMTAGGGMTTIETASRLPIRLVESGPAGGAILASQIAEQLGETELLSFDMGGTTAKLCLIDNYKPQTARKFEIARAERFIKGSGMPVRIPVIEMIEIGAGGGSIAAVDALGRITVGPESAGSEPGPAGFGKGGVHPTVTDSDIELGYIDPGNFAEGRLQIDQSASRTALTADVGKQLQLEPLDAAQGISEIVDESMASAARMHAAESGKDLTSRTMIAFGGNGPLHATRVARKSGVDRIVIPLDPGVGSAVGFLLAPISFEIIKSRHMFLDEIDVAELNHFFEELRIQANEVVRAGAPTGDLIESRVAFMRYAGQGHEIEIDVSARNLTLDDLESLQTQFETEYARLFTRPVPGMRIEILNWGLNLSTPNMPLETTEASKTKRSPRPTGKRSIFCQVNEKLVEAGLYARNSLQPGDEIKGPALIQEAQTTTLVSSDYQATIDQNKYIILQKIRG